VLKTAEHSLERKKPSAWFQRQKPGTFAQWVLTKTLASGNLLLRCRRLLLLLLRLLLVLMMVLLVLMMVLLVLGFQSWELE